MPPPSLRYTTVSVHGDMRDSHVDFVLGRNTRHEYCPATGFCHGDPTLPGAIQYRYGPHRALIENHDFHYTFHVDLEAGVYTKTPLADPWNLPRGRVIRRPPRRSDLTVRVHTSTVDTGERREMFGYQARQVVIRTTRTLGGETPLDEMETEGWYIDPPPAWRILHPPGRRAILVASIHGQMPTPVFSEDGPRETGFPLLATTAHHSLQTTEDGRVHRNTFVDRQEVTEISEAPLDADLFVPPRSFRQVKLLPGDRPVPWPLRARLQWQRIKRALYLPI